MRIKAIYISLLLGAAICTPAAAQVSVGIGIAMPGVNIGINFPAYPSFSQISGYPVYYAPRVNANLFFYDGLYWVFAQDQWYASQWYNGPWNMVPPRRMPNYLLQVPVRYYRQPPQYFHGYDRKAPPHWNERWGHEWEQQRSDWNHYDRSVAPAPAPLPTYQRNYTKDRYPPPTQQEPLHQQHYSYQPRDEEVRQILNEQRSRQKGDAHQSQPQSEHGSQPGNSQGKGSDNGKGKGNDKDKHQNDQG
jgi:hypothetical protein